MKTISVSRSRHQLQAAHDLVRIAIAPVGGGAAGLSSASLAAEMRRPRLRRFEDVSVIDRLFRATALSLSLTVAPLAFAKDAPAPAPAPSPSPAAPAAKELTPGQSAARDRQKKCGAEWRGLTDAQKAAQGPKWPQFWSKCNTRLKGNDKA
jgi:hypothetical protein